jgi:hypothetical protein
MDTDMHKNLDLLDQVIYDMDLTPAQTLVLFNHMIGRFAVSIDQELWSSVLASAMRAVAEAREARP